MKNHPRKTVTIDDSRAGFRIDRLDIGDFSELTRSRIQALIRSGEIRVNGQMVKPSCRLRAGDTVDYHIPDPEPMDLEPLAIPLDILYEDRDIIAVNKPRGMVVHPGAGVSDGTLVHALLHHCSDLSGIGGRQRPGIVHRLDKGTSGVIIAAKNDRAHTGLAAQFAARTMTKKYRALIHGMPHWTEIRVDQPVGRHPSHRLKMTVIPRGRSASTDFILDAYSTEVSLVTARLHTGRTHQIRVHLEYLRHPVLGDTLYAREFVSRLSGAVRSCLKNIEGFCLHASDLILKHPISNRIISLHAPLPVDMQQILDILDLSPTAGKEE